MSRRLMMGCHQLNYLPLVFVLISELLLINTISATYRLSVHNKEVLENVVVGQTVILELSFDATDISIVQLQQAHICFAINGATCFCFEEPYGTAQLTFPLVCAAALPPSWPHYWFSVILAMIDPPINHKKDWYFHDKLHGDNEPHYHQIVSSLPVLIVNPELSSPTSARNPVNEYDQYHSDSLLITLVLPLTLDDLSRAAILLQTLQQVPPRTVLELLVYVPPDQVLIIREALNGLAVSCNFATHVIDESVLFARAREEIQAYSYALQMAIKLLVARHVRTHFYLTLDADILLLRPFQTLDFILRGVDSAYAVSSSSHSLVSLDWLALYHFEPRTVHMHWWLGSEALLRIRPHEHASNEQNLLQGFGVTPALLSTYASLLTIARVCSQLDYEGDAVVCERRWLDAFGQPDGVIWSEYTLYRIVLDYFQLFDGVHVAENTSFAASVTNIGLLSGERSLMEARQQMNTTRAGRLHCYNVWFSSQLPWNASAAYADSSCFFSVVQSTTGASSARILRQTLQHRNS